MFNIDPVVVFLVFPISGSRSHERAAPLSSAMRGQVASAKLGGKVPGGRIVQIDLGLYVDILDNRFYRVP